MHPSIYGVSHSSIGLQPLPWDHSVGQFLSRLGSDGYTVTVWLKAYRTGPRTGSRPSAEVKSVRVPAAWLVLVGYSFRAIT